jgi:hypothetical protein
MHTSLIKEHMLSEQSAIKVATEQRVDGGKLTPKPVCANENGAQTKPTGL